MNQATLSLTGSVNTTVTVNLTDTITSVLDQINSQISPETHPIYTKSNTKILYNGQPLNPAFSLMFYGIQDGSQLFVFSRIQSVGFQSPCNPLSSVESPMLSNTCPCSVPHYSPHRSRAISKTPIPHVSFPQPSPLYNVGSLPIQSASHSNILNCEQPPATICTSSANFFENPNLDKFFNSDEKPTKNIPIKSRSYATRSTNDIINQRMQKFLDDNSDNPNIKDREFLMQRFKDSNNSQTAFETARIVDLYRFKIESNTQSYRKLCKRYKDSTINSKVRKTPSFQTIVPAKLDEPSTDYLPDLCPTNEEPINSFQ